MSHSNHWLDSIALNYDTLIGLKLHLAITRALNNSGKALLEGLRRNTDIEGSNLRAESHAVATVKSQRCA